MTARTLLEAEERLRKMAAEKGGTTGAELTEIANTIASSLAEQPAHSRAQDSGGEAAFRCTVCGSHCDSDGRSLYRPPAEQPAKGECTLGVGDGSGNLFVHGSYDAIKACQGLILRAENPQPSGPADAVAWMHKDDANRVISAKTKASALRDGGASASSVAPYTIRLCQPAAHGAGAAVEAVAEIKMAGPIPQKVLDWRNGMLPFVRDNPVGTKLYTTLPQQRSDEAKPASPNDCRDVSAVIRHGLFFYEVDFGDEGKGCYVRLYDFNRVVEKLEKAAHTAGAAVEAVYQCMCTDEDHMQNGPKNIWMDVDRKAFDSMSLRPDVRSRILYAAPPQQRSEQVAGGGGVDAIVERLKDRTFPNHQCPGESAAAWNVALYEMQRALSTQPLPQPAGVSDAIRALPAKWRQRADAMWSAYSEECRRCAGELEAALHPEQAKDGAAG